MVLRWALRRSVGFYVEISGIDVLYSEVGMSKEKTRVACLLLQENFGDLVESVGCYLLKHGACSLDAIIKGTELTQNQVDISCHDFCIGPLNKS